MLSVKLKLEWPFEPRNFLGGFAPRKEQIQKSPLHLKAVLGEGPGDSGQHAGVSGHVSLATHSRQDGSSCQKVKSGLACGPSGSYLTGTCGVSFHCNPQKAILGNKSDGMTNVTFCSEIQKPYFR